MLTSGASRAVDVRRVAPEDQWDKSLLASVRGAPWNYGALSCVPTPDLEDRVEIPPPAEVSGKRPFPLDRGVFHSEICSGLSLHFLPFLGTFSGLSLYSLSFFGFDAAGSVLQLSFGAVG